MRYAFTCGILNVLISFPAASAESSSSIIPEMMVADKPVDPKCINSVMDSRQGQSINVHKTCPEFWGDGFSAQKQTLVTTAKGAGYDFEYENGKSGGFHYEVVGKTPEGLVVYVYWSTGGSGHWSKLLILKRDGDVLRKIRTVAGGDRAWGGVGNVKVEDGHLLYSYNRTSLALYQKYTQNSSHRGDLGSGFSNVGATVHMKDDSIEGIELAPNAIIPDCFKEKYEKQVATKMIISEDEAKLLIQELSDACPLAGIK